MSRDMSSGRHERLSRVMALLQSKTKATHDELFNAGQYPSERTLQNDLRLLRDEMGIEITYDRANKLYILARAGSLRLNNLEITNEEAEGLIAGLKLAAHFMPHLKSAVDALNKKLAASIPSEAVSRGNNIADAVTANAQCAATDAILLKNLLEAKNNKKAVHVIYLNSNQESDQVISPYEVYFKNGAWRLVGYNHAKKVLSIFNISKVKGVSGAREAYVAPERAGLSGSSLNAALSIARDNCDKKLIRVKAEAGDFADYLKGLKSLKGRTVENSSDGGAILTAEVSSLNIEEIIKEILA